MQCVRAMPDTRVEVANNLYFSQILQARGFHVEAVGDLSKVEGFTGYNRLLDINSVFSNAPLFYPVDRTDTINLPMKWSNRAPWQVPEKSFNLEAAMSARVRYFAQQDCMINVFWSGGIDSTAIVTAFLKYLDDRSRLRVIYSPWSLYEHPEYIDFLSAFPEVELFDQSGEHYLDLDFDGVFITGNGGDEIHASIDDSFLEKHGCEVLSRTWRDLFYQERRSQEFIEFCEQYFSLSGFEIESVLEARWWFYTACKIDGIHREHVVPFLLSNFSRQPLVQDMHAFFNCQEYEAFIYHNLDLIIQDGKMETWKQHLKDFCYRFDGLTDWWKNIRKFHSVQFADYMQKKIALNDRRYIFVLDNNEIIATPNLPLFSYKEFVAKYGNSLDYLFNQPD